MQIDSLLEGGGLSNVTSRQRFSLSVPTTYTRESTQDYPDGHLEVKDVEKPVFESTRMQNAKSVKTILEAVYPRWRALVEAQGREAAGACGLERFDCGAVKSSLSDYAQDLPRRQVTS